MREKERGRQREGKGDGIRVPYIRERAKTRRGRAGAREREAGGRAGERSGEMYRRRAMGYAAGGKRKRKERSGGW